MTELAILILAFVAFVGGAVAGGAWVYSICTDTIDTYEPEQRVLTPPLTRD